jgi:hypothetical protein
MKCKGDREMRVHCLFEQSGTFKNEFKKLGIDAIDYDIQNDFGQTDKIIDLFREIKEGYENKPSIFDNISKDDLIMAFFPCIRFENQILLNMRGENYGMKNWTMKEKMQNCMRLQKEITEMYELVNMLFIICMDKGLKLIVENPYSEEHYLRRYWCCKPTIIDMDRRERGDYYKKPTQYWFINCEPKFNFIFECANYNAIDCKDAIKCMKKEHYEKTGAKNCKVARSMIHPDYANRFIREYLI